MQKEWHKPEHRKDRRLRTLTVKVEPLTAEALREYSKAEKVSQGRVVATLLLKDVGFRAQLNMLRLKASDTSK
jgi:hypothetical protein